MPLYTHILRNYLVRFLLKDKISEPLPDPELFLLLVHLLPLHIKKTQKRANALQNITIPMYSSLVYTITNALEEKDREEFTRLKVIKRMKQKKG